MLLWWKNQFSFLFTRLLFFGFLKQVLFILTMIICFESVSIIKYIHVIILFQLSGNNRNSSRVTVMSFHQQIKNFWHVQNHGSYNFSPPNFKDALRTITVFFYTMESFTIFTSSVLLLSVTIRLGMQLEVASEVQKKNLK